MELLRAQTRLTRGLIASETFDVHDAFGHGIFQKRAALLLIISVFELYSQTAVVPLIAGDVDHWCQQPPNFNISAIIWRKEFIPVEADGRLSRCHVYKYGGDFNHTELIPCQEWEYNSSTAGTTVVSFWNLVCHRRWLLVAAIAAHNSGSVVFCLIAGPISDFFGRAPVIRVAAALMIISTFGSCFVKSYVTYIIIRFVTSGFVSVNCMLSAVMLFEVTTHERRPLDVIFAGSIGGGLADLWLAIITNLPLDWASKQAIYLAPTLLSLTTYIVVQESPRWLISRGNFNGAENVMLEGARMNGYPLANAAYLLNRLREQVRDCNQDCLMEEKKTIDDCPLLRRELIMILSYFSLIFAFYVGIFILVPRKRTLFQWVSFSVVLLAYALMHFLVVRLPLMKVLMICYFILGVIQSLLVMVVYNQPAVITELLLVLSGACVYVGVVTNLAYIMELLPTAVRASALLVMFGCGRIGALCASVVFVLHKAGREDVAFFVAALLLFLSLLALQYLPLATVVECAKINTKRESTSRRQAMEHMKMTLETSRSSKSSKKSGKSFSREKHTQTRPSAST